MTSNQPIKSLDDLFASAQHYAESSMRFGGRVPGTLFLLAPSGVGVYVPQSLGDEQAKSNFAAAARRLAIAHDASAVVMVLEAWTTVSTSGVPLDPTIPPSQAPDRQEVVALVGEAAGVQKVSFLPIQRNAAGTFSGFGETRVVCCDQIQGRFAQILPAQPPTEEERLHAAATLRAMGITQTATGPKSTAPPRHRHRV